MQRMRECDIIVLNILCRQAGGRAEVCFMKRIFLIVADSFGIGAAPDAADYGDEGADTLRTICKSAEFSAENLRKMGLFNIDKTGEMKKEPHQTAACARLCELSKGKDTTTGHWEMAGIVGKNAFPVYPDGFPAEIVSEFEKRTGKKILCNKPYSGTEVIRDYGEEHIRTGALIVYTSADSVFQIAAHENVVSVEELYGYCRTAREILTGKNAVARVIARPFDGEYPDFFRTAQRHDFSLEPPQNTMLDILKENGFDVIGIGKIYDIFAGRGLTEHVFTKNNEEGMREIIKYAEKDFSGLCFLNLVDFDMKFGHRNDIDGYAKAIADFDRDLPKLIGRLGEDDVLFITADHGCDPGFAGTDHTREGVPLIVYGKKICPVNMGTISGFNCIAKTVLSMFGVENSLEGEDLSNFLLK